MPTIWTIHVASHLTTTCLILWSTFLFIHRYPSTTALQRKYTEIIQWQQYRSAVYYDVLDEKYGYPLASKPASAKGTTGWSKFPGIQANKRNKKKRESYSDCLSSSVPVHLHRSDTHGGLCLKRLPARWTPKRVPTLVHDSVYQLQVT